MYLSTETAKSAQFLVAGNTHTHIHMVTFLKQIYNILLYIILILGKVLLMLHAVITTIHMATIYFLHFLTLASELFKKVWSFIQIVLLSQSEISLAFFEASFKKLRVSTQLKATAHEAATLRIDMALGETHGRYVEGAMVGLLTFF